jgi:hypothetical protein
VTPVPTPTTPDPATTPPPAATSASEPLRVLFVGNSYTFYNNLPGRFAELMHSGGFDVEVGQSTNGGWSLSNHTMSSQTPDKIAGTEWHYVVLQEQSVVHNPEGGMYPAVRALDRQSEAVGARTVLFMTWGRQEGLPKAGYPDYASMQAQIAANYVGIAAELDLILAPVGIAWQSALAQDPELDLWSADGSHPSPTGTYLASCVFYAVVAGESPEGLAYTAGLPGQTARFLQLVAAETVMTDARFPTPP